MFILTAANVVERFDILRSPVVAFGILLSSRSPDEVFLVGSGEAGEWRWSREATNKTGEEL